MIAVADTPMVPVVGQSVSGGTANRILFEDASNLLAESADLTWDNASSILAVGGAVYPTGSDGAGSYQAPARITVR